MKARIKALLQNPVFLTITLVAFIILLATLAYKVMEGWSLLNALIFTLSTITTTGFSKEFPIHTPALIFTAALMLLTLGTVVIALSTYASRLVNLVSRGVSPMELNERTIHDLKDHIIVAAEGNLSLLLTQSLRVKGLPFVVVTQDEALHARWLEDGVPSILGNPDEEDILHRAGVERATGLIVALDSDADNVFISLSAHDLNPRLRIIARAHNSLSIPKLRRSGADEVVLTEQVTAINLVDLFESRSRVSALVQQVTEELRETLKSSKSQPAVQHANSQQILFRALRLALQELSPDMESTLYALGKQFGREAVGPNLTGESLCDVLSSLAPVWIAAGLGDITVKNCTEESAVIEEQHCATCEGLPNVGKPVCHLERGVLNGALEVVLNRTVRTKETKCWGLGDHICEFEIMSDLHNHS